MKPYFNRADRYHEQGVTVRIDGKCYSACTTYLMAKYAANTCVTDRAEFGFHQPYDINLFNRIVDPGEYVLSVKRRWWNGYPAKVRRFLQRKGWPSVYEGAGRYEMVYMRDVGLKRCK